MDPAKEELVNAVKGIQRSTAEGRSQWEKYVDATKTGSRDPSRHTADSLQNFLNAYRQGVSPEVVASQVGGSRVLRLRGVPFQCTTLEVQSFLSEYGVMESNVALGRRPDGRVTGEAFVQFKNEAVAERALEDKQKQEIQGRYIELFRSTDEEWNEASQQSPMGWASCGNIEKDNLVVKVKEIQRAGQDAKDKWYRFCDATRTGNRDPARHDVESLKAFLVAYEHGDAPELPAATKVSSSRVLRLRGVPFQSDVLDVVVFLKDYGVVESNVLLARSAEGRKTGEAYAVFETPELAEKAMEEKQNAEIRGRYIEIFRSTYEERDQAMQQATVAAQHAAMQGRYIEGAYTGASEKEELVGRIKSIQRSGHDGKAKWERYCDAARTGNRDPNLHSAESMRSFLEAYARGEDPEAPARRIATGTNVLRLRGVPFQSDITDVVEFLAGYGVDPAEVALARSPDGKPTGEAYASFGSVEVAERALEEKQKQEIRGRYIELFRSSAEEKAQHTTAGYTPMGFSKEREKEELVARVKQIQRSRQDGKSRWEEYCNQLATGNRDPSRHTAETIKNFLDAFERGETPQVVVGAGGPVLRLRGVPFQSDVQEVVEFLAQYGVDPSAVVMGRAQDGRKTGEAFVTFATTELAEMALEERQKQEIMGRYIELFRSNFEERDLNSFDARAGMMDKEDLVTQVKTIQRSSQQGREQWERYCEAMRTGNRDPLKHTAESMMNFLQAYHRGEAPEMLAAKVVGASRVVRLRGVPFQSDPMDVVQFLKDYGVDGSQVVMTRGPDGRMTGEAFVTFPSPELAERALDEKQKQEIRGRYIELFRSSDSERDESLSASMHGPGGGCGMGPRLPANAAMLRMIGLPMGVKVQDVCEFLKEFFVDSSQIVVPQGAESKTAGEAFVACAPEVAQMIMQEKNMYRLGKRQVEIYPSTYDECTAAAKGQRKSKQQEWPDESSFGGAWGPKGGACGKGFGWGSSWEATEGPCGKGYGWKGCMGKGPMCGKGGGDSSYGPMFGGCGKGGCGSMDGPYGKGNWDQGWGSGDSYGMCGKGGPQTWGGSAGSKGCGGMGDGGGQWKGGGGSDGWMKGGCGAPGGCGGPDAWGGQKGACGKGGDSFQAEGGGMGNSWPGLEWNGGGNAAGAGKGGGMPDASGGMDAMGAWGGMSPGGGMSQGGGMGQGCGMGQGAGMGQGGCMGPGGGGGMGPGGGMCQGGGMVQGGGMGQGSDWPSFNAGGGGGGGGDASNFGGQQNWAGCGSWSG